MTDHFDRLTILSFIENDTSIDREAVASHLAGCAACRDAHDDLQGLIALLSDGSVLDFIDDLTVGTDRATISDTVRAVAERDAQETIAAEALFIRLVTQPVETWEATFAGHPSECTPGMVRRLLDAVRPELDRRAEYALDMLRVAEFVANTFEDGDTCNSMLGDVWKQRSNALRQLARYDEALDAAALAEAFYAAVRTGTFDMGQAQYTRAVTLFKMTRYSEALDVLATARATLEDYGSTLPLAKTMMLEAGIRYEQGDEESAARIWRNVIPVLTAFDQPLELARARGNLAACGLRRGQFEQARKDAEDGLRAYRALGNKAEETRVEWTIAMIELATGREDEGLDQLHDAAVGFESLGMVGDAGFVKLDITEELLRRELWVEAELIARALVTLFRKAGVTIASVMAVDYLRQAVEQRLATTATVRYVRDYVTADDPRRPFSPPELGLIS